MPTVAKHRVDGVPRRPYGRRHSLESGDGGERISGHAGSVRGGLSTKDSTSRLL